MYSVHYKTPLNLFVCVELLNDLLHIDIAIVVYCLISVIYYCPPQTGIILDQSIIILD